MEDCINIDDMSDYEGKLYRFIEEMIREKIDERAIFIPMDGNDLSMFGDETFDEIYSNQCFGLYVTNYDEMVRVLKMGGTVSLGVWSHAIQKVVGNLIKRGVKITSVKGFNGPYEDTIIEDCDNVDGDDYYTVMIEGIKVKDEQDCYY